MTHIHSLSKYQLITDIAKDLGLVIPNWLEF